MLPALRVVAKSKNGKTYQMKLSDRVEPVRRRAIALVRSDGFVNPICADAKEPDA